jgi:hypothetical protein
MILLSILQVDGVMRVFAQTRFLLALNLMRLAIIAGLLKWSLSEFHLLGPVLVIVLATLAFQGGGADPDEEAARNRRRQLLPWRSLAALLGASTAQGRWPGWSNRRCTLPLSRSCSRWVWPMRHIHRLVWRFDLLNESERLAIAGWARKLQAAARGAFGYGKG